MNGLRHRQSQVFITGEAELRGRRQGPAASIRSALPDPSAQVATMRRWREILGYRTNSEGFLARYCLRIVIASEVTACVYPVPITDAWLCRQALFVRVPSFHRGLAST